MLSRIKLLLFLPLFLMGKPAVHAQELQDNDYLLHTKVFYLCDFQRECSGCFECTRQKYWVKIKNRAAKKIAKVSYVFYSDVYNHIVTKEAKMEGPIDPLTTGRLYVCIPDGKHWAISEIVYDDNTSVKYVVKDRLSTFEQEPDECECNPRTTLPDPNFK